MILLNLFLAILLKNFDDPEEQHAAAGADANINTQGSKDSEAVNRSKLNMTLIGMQKLATQCSGCCCKGSAGGKKKSYQLSLKTIEEGDSVSGRSLMQNSKEEGKDGTLKK